MKTTIKPTMHNSKVHLLIAATVIGFGLATQPSSLLAQGTAFTYQGRLDSGGAPYTGNAEFQPTLWDAASGGAQVAANSPAQVTVGVTNGLFTLPLDFGASFPGADRWLQLEVRTKLISSVEQPVHLEPMLLGLVIQSPWPQLPIPLQPLLTPDTMICTLSTPQLQAKNA